MAWFDRAGPEQRFQALLKIAEVAEADGHPAAMLEPLREAVTLQPDEPSGHAYLGWALLRNGDAAGARAEFGTYVRQVGRARLRPPREASARKGCLQAFFSLFESLWPRRGDQPHELACAVAGFLSQAYLELGRVSKSRSWIRRSLAHEDASRSAEILYQRGVLAAAEDADRARGVRDAVAWLLKADLQDPDFLHRRIRRLRTRLEAQG